MPLLSICHEPAPQALPVIQHSDIPCIQIFISSCRKLRAWGRFCNAGQGCRYWNRFRRGDTSSKRPLYDSPSSDALMLNPQCYRRTTNIACLRSQDSFVLIKKTASRLAFRSVGGYRSVGFGWRGRGWLTMFLRQR